MGRHFTNPTKLHQPASTRRPIDEHIRLAEEVYHRVCVPYYYKGMDAFGPPSDFNVLVELDRRFAEENGWKE